MEDRRAWTKKQKRRYILEASTAAERFSRIYDVGFWEGGGEETVSGYGSTIQATAKLRSRLPEVIAGLQIGSIFDAPCGDFNWMKAVRPQLPVRYVGGDIVAPLVAANQERYGDERTAFICFDISLDRFPGADVWLCRDCLFHLSDADIFRALALFAESSIPLILTTTHKNAGEFENTDIESGSFRKIDLFSAPYCLPSDPILRFDDWCDEHPKEMCLWTRGQIASALAGRRAGALDGGRQ